jgi:hypothetical protein
MWFLQKAIKKHGLHTELIGLTKEPVPAAVKHGDSEWLFVMLTTRWSVSA